MKHQKTTTRKNGTKKIVTVNDGKSMTDQSQKNQVDAKLIVKQFLKTGVLSHVNQSVGQFADVSEVEDLYDSMTKVKKVEHFFHQLPSDIRKKLDNDPKKLLEVMLDPKKEAQKEELGLNNKEEIEPKLEPEPPKEKPKDEKDT